jgi:pimeloyl-ACP methyl ester carboxylesterase
VSGFRPGWYEISKSKAGTSFCLYFRSKDYYTAQCRVTSDGKQYLEWGDPKGPTGPGKPGRWLPQYPPLANAPPDDWWDNSSNPKKTKSQSAPGEPAQNAASSQLDKTKRSQVARPDSAGKPSFQWSLTDSSITDTVKLIAGPFDVLPIVFVPGIMGSNLKGKDDGKPVWRLDTGIAGVPWGMLRKFATKDAGPRQQLLHPDRCVVDDGGAIPTKLKGSVYSKDQYRRRGWGTVGSGSYHSFLLWLEEQLNPDNRNPVYWHEFYQDETTIGPIPDPNVEPKLLPGIRMGIEGQPFGAEKPFKPVTTDDLLKRSKFVSPVYAVGYNWLASNRDGAQYLREKILAIIKENDAGSFRCEQVIVVTHSMGGLVARACALLPQMAEKIAGIVHGVMPATGAAVAYRRCKVGMRDEDFGSGLVIGSTGQEVTAVFAQAPGALQLLPAQTYPANWLQVKAPNGAIVETWPAAGAGGNDPYESIYKRRDRWWGLVKETWLSPKDGAPIEWSDFSLNVDAAKKFHASLIGKYHANSFVYYGSDQKSFERVTWKMVKGLLPDQKRPPNVDEVLAMSPDQARMGGSNPEYVGGQQKYSSYVSPYGGGTTVYETSYWELHFEMQDGGGDGTVPLSSGSAPLAQGGSGIQQQFKLQGFGHEASFRDGVAQRATVFAITKIAGNAKRPQ